MTELQVLAMRQMAISLAAFESDHRKIVSGDLKMDADDTYDSTEVGQAIEDMQGNMEYLCSVGGRTDL